MKTNPKPRLLTGDRPTGRLHLGHYMGSLANRVRLQHEAVAVKIKGMYTDPNRLLVTDPATVEGNSVFIYHDAFNPDRAKVGELKERYRLGQVGDVEVKARQTMDIVRAVTGLAYSQDLFADEIDLFGEYEETGS